MHSLIYTHILSHLLLFAMHSLIYTHILSPLDQVLIEKPQNVTESTTPARDQEALSRFYVTKLSIVLDLCSYGYPKVNTWGVPF